MQSGKYAEAENFNLKATVHPNMNALPIVITPPAEWYRGIGQ